MYSVNIYEFYYNDNVIDLIKSLFEQSLDSEIVADIVRMSIDDKKWSIIEHINKFNLNDFDLYDCNFNNYSLDDLRKFKELTALNPPEYLFNKLIIQHPEIEKELLDFFGEHCLNDFYDYLLGDVDQHYKIIMKLIESNKFPLNSISIERYCELVYFTFPESEFFMNLALKKYDNLFYSHLLNFLIKNYSCKHELYKYLIDQKAVNTIKPNLKEFERYTNNPDFLSLLKTL